MPIASRFTGAARASSTTSPLLDHFARPPWNLRYLQGHLDAPFLNLTPGTRTGIIHDSAYMTFARDCSRSRTSSSKSSKRSAARRKSRRAGSSCAPSSARSAKRCWPCRPRNMTGSTFSAQRSQPVSDSSEAAPTGACHRTRFEEPFPGHGAGARTSGDGSSSNSPVRCSAWRCHRYRVSCGSAPRRNCGRSRGPLAASYRGGLGISLAGGRRPGHAHRRT